MILKNISERRNELTAVVDSSLAALLLFLATTRSSLPLGEGISAVLRRMIPLQRELGRALHALRQGSQDALSSANEVQRDTASRLCAERESFRVEMNGVRTELDALRAGEESRFKAACADLQRLLQRIVNSRRLETVFPPPCSAADRAIS